MYIFSTCISACEMDIQMLFYCIVNVEKKFFFYNVATILAISILCGTVFVCTDNITVIILSILYQTSIFLFIDILIELKDEDRTGS